MAHDLAKFGATAHSGTAHHSCAARASLLTLEMELEADDDEDIDDEEDEAAEAPEAESEEGVYV